MLASPAGCKPAREEVLASQKPSTLPTELSGRPEMEKEMLQNLYKPILRPHAEYAVTECTPIYKKDMVAIENAQRRATKRVRTISHSTYKERLKSLGFPYLEYRRERADLVEVYKIMNGINDVDKNKFFNVSTQQHVTNL